MILLLVFMQLTRDLFVIAKFLFILNVKVKDVKLRPEMSPSVVRLKGSIPRRTYLPGYLVCPKPTVCVTAVPLRTAMKGRPTSAIRIDNGLVSGMFG